MKKRILSIFFAFALVFTPLLSLVGSAFDGKDCPYIYVHGFMGTTIYKDKNDASKGEAWPPSADTIIATVKETLPSISDLLITKNYKEFFIKTMEPLKDLLCTANLGPDGTASDGSGIIWKWPSASSINKNSELSFRYDWRLDPIELATQLNAFIEYVCAAAKCDKICIEGHSFGGVVINTYTKLFGTNRIKSACYNTTAVFGETYTGELLTGQIKIDSTALLSFLKEMVGYLEVKNLLNEVFDLIYATGLVDKTVNLGNELIANAPVEEFTEVVLPIFAGWLSIWAMIPDEYVTEAKYYVFDELYGDHGNNHKGLYEKIENFNTKIRPYKVETMLKTNEDCNLYIITRYGYASIPITPSWQNLSDSVIDTKFSSMGASCCDYGKRYNDNFIKENANNPYISPNGQIDASTCLFPEQTWFIRSLEHSTGCKSFDEMILTLLYHDGQATVDTFKQYPRYMEYDYTQDIIQPDSFSFEQSPKTFLEKVKEFFTNLYHQLLMLIYMFK